MRPTSLIIWLLLLELSMINSTPSFEDDSEELYSEPDNQVNPDESYRMPFKERKGRIFWSYPQSPIVDMMMQSVAPNYVAQNPEDPFDFLRDKYPLPKGFTSPLGEYDYVIIGAGTAGSVVAARLSEDKPRAKVLVLEAGKPEMLLTDIPVLAPYFQRTNYAWQYYMEPQSGICMGLENRRCFWPRGKAVGGTSVINYMIYTRGRPEDWNRIAADGNDGWSYNDVLKYYMKSERCELRHFKNSPYRGKDGELSVENPPFRTGLQESWLEAGRSFGHPTVDYNAPDSYGFGYVQAMMQKGHRLSAAKAFLHPHKRRKNLHILTESKVVKILIDPQTRKAYGVEYVKNRLKYTIKIRREIILSAGPIASPQLLMLSGVGPNDHLRSLGIPVIQNLNVGRVLYDHIGFPGVIFHLSSNNASIIESKVATVQNLMQWIQFGDGLMASPGGVEGIGYLKTSNSEDPGLIPDIEIINLGGSITMDNGGAIRKGMKITDETYNSAFGPVNGIDTWSAIPLLLQPKSKGYLELKDTNPFSPPKMVGNYLSDPRDIKTIIEGIRYIIKLGESEPFKKYGAKLHQSDYPLCRMHPFGSDRYWECAIRTLTITFHHQIATCKMGPISDPEAVVDSELRVHGIEGLRVIDSSILPRPITAHTAAPAIMIGEKGADLIKKAWSNHVL